MISPNQSVFVPGRLITDNVLIAFECIHSLQHVKNGDNSLCTYKVDLSKAYDRVDWNFLHKVLLKLVFHSQWVRWVMSCVTSVRYTVCLNGVRLDSFQPTRGLRQGDSLSPFLFLFVADALSALLKKEVQNHTLSLVKVTRNATGVSHLLFADENFLFFKAETQ
jgi:hypothetical protein